MLKNYFTSVLRYVQRNKVFTIINILGLAIGMTACMLITQFVLHEFSYDDFHDKKDRIYRIQLDRYDKGQLSTRWAAGCAGIGPDLKADFPEVKDFVRLTPTNALLSTGNVFFREESVYYSTESFFNIFSVKLLEGDPATALKEPFKIVISKTLAKKYFGNETAVGKTLKNNGRDDYEVSGVFEDLPENTHLKLNAMMSFSTLYKLWNDPSISSWMWDGFLTYILLDSHVDAKAFEAKLPAYVDKKVRKELKEYNADMVFHLQPITDIHLDSDFIMEFKANGNRQSTYFLSIVAVLILVIAWINYVNLSTAKSVERAREVGVRKVMGSFRWQLVQQFMFESLLLNTLSVTIAILFVILLTPSFAEMTGRELGYLLFSQKMFWLWTAILIIGGACLSGIYPALVLSSYKPVEVLKGRFKNTSQGVFFRRGMVVAQFITSITLTVGTFTVYQQINFMRSQKLGVNIDQTLVMQSPSVPDSSYQSLFKGFKESILKHAEVKAMTASSSVPGNAPDWNAGGIRRLSQRSEDANQYRVIMMDHDFIPAYGLHVVEGRAFSGEVQKEDKNVILNQSACKLMGFEKYADAINDQIFFWGDTFRIVGVVEDYHQESLKKAFDPLIFRYSATPGGMYSIKFNTAHVKESIAKFEEEWRSFFPENPFSYFFLDDHYNKQYKADQQFGEVFGVFSGLAIFIACLGLFGLSSLTALQRTKEIGVRKVLGASVSSILTLVSKDYIILMLVAITLACPFAYWIMNNWLQDFANRISLSWWIFALPGLGIIFISLLTVSIHTLKAARTNPATSLRYE